MGNHGARTQASIHARFGRVVGAALTASLVSLIVGSPRPAAAALSAASPIACFSQPIATGTGSGASALVAGDFFNHHNGTLDVVTGNNGRIWAGPRAPSRVKGRRDVSS